MSRLSAIFLVLIAGTLIAVVTWFVLRSNPDALRIPAKPLPLIAEIKIAPGDWPWWRGPTRDNHSPDAEAPTKWSESENVIWKTAIPGRGHSTPILVGDKVFVTTADEKLERQMLFCFNRTTGEKLWEARVLEKNFPTKHPDNSQASSTPASDGQRVFVAFANNKAIHVAAFDLTGDLQWLKEIGPHGGGGSHGYGSSLAIWGPCVYVLDDSPGQGWIAALNRETGDTIWREPRSSGTGSYGSPLITELDGKTQLIVVGTGRVISYNPHDGGIAWVQIGLAEVSGNTVAVSPKMIFASSGYPKRNFLALKGDGTIAWKKENSNEFPYPPSMLWHEGHLYVLSDQGLLTCYEAETGKQKWKERVTGSYYSSPIIVGKNLYICNREGLTTVYEVSPEGATEIARNKLDAGINASLVAIGGRLYLRTETHLYCIGKK